MARILWACLVHMAIVMSGIEMSPEVDFALKASLPCLTMESATVQVSDLSNTSSPEEGVALNTSLEKLEQAINVFNYTLSNLTSRTPWHYSIHYMESFRPRLHFHWTLDDEDDGMTEQEKERLKILLRLTGYAVLLKTAITSTSASIVYSPAGLTVLKELHEQIQKVNCQLRHLLLKFSDRTIYLKALKSKKPNGLAALQGSLKFQPIQRVVTYLAIEDMHKTFSHLEVTGISIYLGN